MTIILIPKQRPRLWSVWTFLLGLFVAARVVPEFGDDFAIPFEQGAVIVCPSHREVAPLVVNIAVVVANGTVVEAPESYFSHHQRQHAAERHGNARHAAAVPRYDRFLGPRPRAGPPQGTGL